MYYRVFFHLVNNLYLHSTDNFGRKLLFIRISGQNINLFFIKLLFFKKQDAAHRFWAGMTIIDLKESGDS